MTCGREPSVSIIVTAYNYGHFLASCLESVRSQTLPPDELIVVDDGSEDATSEILAQEKDVKFIAQSNKGQAAAFNAGYAATTSDIVIFLDADDRLKPDALEILKKIWSDDISVLSFGLEMVDRDGLAVGKYDMRMPSVDLLPRLVQDIVMPFMPTSGNAFSRQAIDFAFPLPEPRWKICADALLIRAAVLAGPAKHTPHVLAEYRVHRHNNWFQEVATKDWRLQRGHLDVAQVGLDLVDLSERKTGPDLSNTMRLLLLFATLKAGAKAAELGEGTRTLRPFLNGVLKRWSPIHGLRPFIALCTLWLFLPLSGRMRSWLIDRPSRPDFANKLAKYFVRAAISQNFNNELSPRAPFNRSLSFSTQNNRPLDALFTSAAWSRHYNSAFFELCEDRGEIVFRRPKASAVDLLLTMEPTSNDAVGVELRQNGSTITRFELNAYGCVPVHLRAIEPFAPQEETIEICVTSRNRGLRRFRNWAKPSSRLKVHSVGLREIRSELVGAAIPVGRGIDVSTIRTSLVAEDGPADVLFVAAPEIEGDYALMIRFGSRQATGWFSVSVFGVIVFQGNILPEQTVLADFSGVPFEVRDRFELTTTFQANGREAEDELDIVELGWTRGNLAPENSIQSLIPGRWMGPNFRTEEQKLLAHGWALSTDTQPTMFESNALLRFSLGPYRSKDTFKLKVDLAPLGDIPADQAPAVILSMSGRRRAAVRLGGRHILEVNFSGNDVGMNGICELGVHVGDVTETNGFAPHGGVTLFGLCLESGDLLRTLTQIEHEPPPHFLKLAEVARSKQIESADREALMLEINGLATRALTDFLEPATLERLSELGRRDPVQSVLTLPASNSPEWLRWFAVSMLNGPLCVSAPEMKLSNLPWIDETFHGPVGRWIGATPEKLPTEMTPEILGYWQAERLREIRDLLAVADHNSSQFKIASHALKAMDIGATSTFAGPAFVRAIELFSLRDGVPTGRPPTTCHGGTGILVSSTKDLHKGGRLAQLADALSTDNPVTILAGEGNAIDAPSAILLEGQTKDSAVRYILGLGLDTLYVVAPLTKFNIVTALSAERLAHRQIALGPVPPFSNLDAIARGAWFDVDETVLPGLGFFPATPAAEHELILARARALSEDSGLHIHVAASEGLSKKEFLVSALEEKIAGATVSSEILGCSASNANSGQLAADLVLSIGGTAEETVAKVLELGVPGIAYTLDAAEQKRLSRCLSELGLSNAFAQSAEDAVSQIVELAQNEKTRAAASRAFANAMVKVSDSNGALFEWCVNQSRPAPEAPRYLFHHLVKTGGTSLKLLFHDWFDVTEDYRTPWKPEIGAPVDLMTCQPNHMIVGHFATDGFPLADRYPSLANNPNWRRISFVRDPYELALSWYNFERLVRPSYDPEFTPLPIDEFFETYTGRYLTHFECSADDWKEVIDAYWFIGTLERMDACVDYLAAKLDRPRIDVVRHNVTQEKEHPSPRAVAIFAERMALEFEIYRYIDAQLSERLAET